MSDDAGDVYARFEIPAQPAFVIISADGTQQQLLGAVESDVLDRLLSDALS